MTTKGSTTAEWARRLRAARNDSTARADLFRDTSDINFAAVVHESDDSDDNVEAMQIPARSTESTRTRILERARRRQQRSSTPATVGELTELERNAVGPSTTAQYQIYKEALWAWTGLSEALDETDHVVDEMLVQYLNTLFLRGFGVSVAEKTFAAFQFFAPDFGRGGSRHCPRALRALKGFRRLAPPRSLVPETWPVIAALIMGLTEDGFLDMGLWVLIGFGLYLRPSENMQLHREDLMTLCPPASPWWTFNLSPESRGLSRKTGTSDDAVVWDRQELAWAAHSFPHLVQNARRDGRVWSFSYLELVKATTKVAKRLGIEFAPYQLRHSGPSWERLYDANAPSSASKRGAGGGRFAAPPATRRRAGCSSDTACCPRDSEITPKPVPRTCERWSLESSWQRGRGSPCPPRPLRGGRRGESEVATRRGQERRYRNRT